MPGCVTDCRWAAVFHFLHLLFSIDSTGTDLAPRLAEDWSSTSPLLSQSKHVCEWPCVCVGAGGLGCMSVCNERAWPQRLHPCPAALTLSLWWKVVDSVEVSGVWVFVFSGEGLRAKSVWVSFLLPRRPSGEPKSGSSRLFSCYSVMIHDKHLPEWAPGCFGLWAKCLCKCSVCVYVCVRLWSNTCTDAFQRGGRCG